MMKKLLVVVIAIAIMLVGASAAMATIKDSKHDLSNTNATAGYIKNSGATGLSACQFCHTPHLGPNPAVNQAPLWNRTINAGFLAGDNATSYTVYGATAAGVNGQTLGGTTINAPGGNSKTCLSCHDGTLSLGDVLVGTDVPAFFDPTGTKLTGGNRLTDTTTGLTPDLTNEHPVGFVVDTSKAGLALSLATMQSASAKFYGAAGSERMECGTCHDPHTTGLANQPKFLRMNINTMCTDCHVSK